MKTLATWIKPGIHGICLSLVPGLGLTLVHAGDLAVEVSNIRNTDGSVLITVFDNAGDYDDDSGNPGKYLTLVSLKAGQPVVRVTFPEFPAGTCAIVALHDENNNLDLDSNLLGMPTEGLSFSNFDRDSDFPTFEHSAFRYRQGQDSNQSMPLVYFD